MRPQRTLALVATAALVAALGAGTAQAADPAGTPAPGDLTDVHPVAWDQWQKLSATSIRVWAWTGSPVCAGLTAQVAETGTIVTITTFEGTRPGAELCPAIAAHTPVDIQLDSPLGLRRVSEPGGIPTGYSPGGYTTTAPPVTSATPVVRGRARVGQRLRVGTAGWTYGTSFSYRWFADGEPIPGAFRPTLGVRRSLVGTRLRVRVKGFCQGYSSSVWIASRATGKVRPRS